MKDSIILEFDFTGKELRDAGISLAEETAENFNPGWKQAAYELIKEFLKDNEGEFMCEDIRAYAAVRDFDLPKNPQAWAGPLMRVKKEGLIEFVRYGNVRNPKAHARPASIWRKK